MASLGWRRSSRRTATWLLLLLTLFIVRVLAQLLVAVGWGNWLPPFEAFMSGLLPYPYLLPAQIAIIALYGRVWKDFRAARGIAHPHRGWGIGLLGFGWIYLLSMVYRFYLWARFHPGTLWMGGPIPPVFHWVLASFILLVGFHHWRKLPTSGADGSGGKE